MLPISIYSSKLLNPTISIFSRGCHVAMRNHVRNSSNRNRERCKAAVQNNPRRSFCTAAFLCTKERVRERWRRHCDFASAGSVLFAWMRMRNRMFWFRTAVSRETGGFVNSAVNLSIDLVCSFKIITRLPFQHWLGVCSTSKFFPPFL